MTCLELHKSKVTLIPKSVISFVFWNQLSSAHTRVNSYYMLDSDGIIYF